MHVYSMCGSDSLILRVICIHVSVLNCMCMVHSVVHMCVPCTCTCGNWTHYMYAYVDHRASCCCGYARVGEIRKKGVVRPTTKDVYVPILERLKLEGIEATVTKHRT